ncbi:hypothetical protein B6254_1989 [Weissella cibaria]|uniref:Uncharacterized protein n=1 Tax=Weissella cibaria TaxID=137591 RepID=A0A2S1KTP5_9LACO|nr:hypothetical protein B6254_1989 [Weissella cibaria]
MVFAGVVALRRATEVVVSYAFVQKLGNRMARTPFSGANNSP